MISPKTVIIVPIIFFFMGRVSPGQANPWLNIIRQPCTEQEVNGGKNTVNESWNDFRVKWDPLLLVENHFGLTENLNGLRLPRKVVGVQSIDANSKCINQIDSVTFYGHRRLANSRDNSVVALYDQNGVVCGIQVRFPQNEALVAGNNYRFDLVPMFQTEMIQGQPFFVLTAYFVDPETICRFGGERRDRNFESDPNFGTGDRLLFQNGPSPSNLFRVPKMRGEAIMAGFSDNNCFPGMGKHSFYQVEKWKEDNCATIFPVFLLFNNADYLIGFGFDWIGKRHYQTNKFERPPSFAIQTILGPRAPAPECLLRPRDRSIRVNTMHVFFVRRNPSCVC